MILPPITRYRKVFKLIVFSIEVTTFFVSLYFELKTPYEERAIDG